MKRWIVIATLAGVSAASAEPQNPLEDPAFLEAVPTALEITREEMMAFKEGLTPARPFDYNGVGPVGIADKSRGVRFALYKGELSKEGSRIAEQLLEKYQMPTIYNDHVCPYVEGRSLSEIDAPSIEANIEKFQRDSEHNRISMYEELKEKLPASDYAKMDEAIEQRIRHTSSANSELPRKVELPERVQKYLWQTSCYMATLPYEPTNDGVSISQ